MAGTQSGQNRSYRDILNATSSETDTEELLEAIEGTSDRAVALLCAAHIDVMLDDMLIRYLPNTSEGLLESLHRQGGPLNSLSNKITLSRALNLINEKANKELELIRRIRNAFAHSALQLLFKEPALSRMCLGLDADGMHLEMQEHYGAPNIPTVQEMKSIERRNFSTVSIGYLLIIGTTTINISKNKGLDLEKELNRRSQQNDLISHKLG